MATNPPLRRLRVEEYPKQKDWISSLLLILNNFMEITVGAFDKGITIIENTTSDVKTVSFAGTYPVSVAWTKKSVPRVVVVGDVERVDGATFTLASAVQVQWNMSSDGKSLQISAVVGLTPSPTDQYNLTLLCIAG